MFILTYLKLTMKKSLLLLLPLLLQLALVSAQQIIQIGNQALVPASTLYAPFYRLSAASTIQMGASVIHYTQAELQAAGIVPGTRIDSLAFNKANNAASISNFYFQMWLGSSNRLLPLATSTLWDSILVGKTQVMNDFNFQLTPDTGWVIFRFQNSYIYLGGDLEIASFVNYTAFPANLINGAVPWQYSNGHSGQVLGVVGNTIGGNTPLNGNVAAHKERPNIRFYCAPALQTDVGVGPINSLVAPMIKGSALPVTLQVRNSGINTIQSFSLSFQLNQEPVQTQNFSSTLLSGQATNVTFNSSITLPQTDQFRLRCWVSAVNALTFDNDQQNDTTGGTFFTALNSGIYNIGPAGHFQNLSAALNHVQFGGLNGGVTLDLLDNQSGSFRLSSYPGQAISNLTLTSSAAIPAKLTTNGTSTLLHLIDVGNVNVANLDFERTSGPTILSYLLLIDSSQQINIANCRFFGHPGNPSPNNTLVRINSSEHITFTSNTFKAGFGGLHFHCFPNSVSNNHLVNGNNFEDMFSTPILFDALSNQNVFHSQVLIEKNLVNNQNIPPALSSGILLAHCRLFSIKANTLLGNYGGSVINLNNFDGDVFNPNEISNNLISANSSSGVLRLQVNSNGLQNRDFVRVIHNSFQFITSSTALNLNAAISVIGGSASNVSTNGIEFINNLCIVRHTGTRPVNLRMLMLPNRALIDSGLLYFSHNHYHNQGGSFAFISSPNTQLPTLASWRALSPGLDTFSVDTDPFVVNMSLNALQPIATSPLVNTGLPLGLVGTDISGRQRDSLPDIGAFEYQPIINSVVMQNIVQPAGILAPGSMRSVTVQVNNLGGNVLSSLQLHYRLGNGPIVTESWTGSINTGDSLVYTFTQQLSLPATFNTIQKLQVWCSLPNGQIDFDVQNDSLRKNLCIAIPAGTYQVGLNGAFEDPQEMADYLSCAGITGPVKMQFNLINNAFLLTKPILFDSIPGTSALHTVEIDGQNDTLFANNSPQHPAFVHIRRSRHLIFRNFHLVSLSGSHGHGFVVHASDSIRIVGNRINLSTVSGSSWDASNGILVSAVPTSGNSPSFVNHLQIDSNTIIGGNAGIRLTSNSALRSRDVFIRSNVIRDFFEFGLHLTHVDSGFIQKNDLHRENRFNPGPFTGIWLSNVEGLWVAQNRIHDSHNGSSNPNSAAIGINLRNSVGVKSNYLVNNLIYNLSTQNTVTGIEVFNASKFEIHHNSIRLFDTFLVLGNVRGIKLTASNFQYRILNNVIAIRKSGPNTRAALELDLLTTNPVEQINYNCYSVNGNGGLNALVINGSLNYFNLSDWRAAQTVFDGQSIEAHPQFHQSNGWGLLPTNGQLYQKGLAISFVPTDFDGQAQSTPPSLGAFAFTPPLHDLWVERIITPLDSSCVPNLNIPLEIQLTNAGLLSTGQIIAAYRLNQQPVVSDTILAGVPFQGVLRHTFRQAVPFTNGRDTLLVYAKALNDVNAGNDSLRMIVGNSLASLLTVPFAEDFESPVLPNNFCISKGDSARITTLGNGVLNYPLNGSRSLILHGSISGNGWLPVNQGTWWQMNSDYKSDVRLHVATNGLRRLRLTFKILHVGISNNQNFRVLANGQELIATGQLNASVPPLNIANPVSRVLTYDFDNFLNNDTLTITLQASIRWGIENQANGRIILDSLRLFEPNEIRFKELSSFNQVCTPSPRSIEVRLDTIGTPANVRLMYSTGGGYLQIPMSRMAQAGKWMGTVPAVAPKTMVKYAVLANQLGQTYSSDTLTYISVPHQLQLGADRSLNAGQSTVLNAHMSSFAGSTLRITEFVFNRINSSNFQTIWPTGIPNNAASFIEISNMGLDTVSLVGMRLDLFSGSNRWQVIFPSGARLLPGKVAVIVPGSTADDTVNQVYAFGATNTQPGLPSVPFGAVLRNHSNVFIHDVFIANDTVFPSDLEVPSGSWNGFLLSVGQSGAYRLNALGNGVGAWTYYTPSDTTNIGYFNQAFPLLPPASTVSWFAGNTFIGTGYQRSVSPSSNTVYRASVDFLGCTLRDTVSVNVFTITGPELSFRRIIEPSGNPIRFTNPLPLRAMVQNQGIAGINSFEVRVRVNNNLIAQQTFNQALPAGDSTVIQLNQTWSPISGAYNLCFDVIGQGDDNPGNNTLCINGLQVTNAVSVGHMVTDGWQLYPNPSQTHLKLRFPEGDAKYHLEWHDATGRLLGTNTYHTEAGPEMTFDVAQLTNGVYFFRILAPSGKQIRLRFVVAR
jgi:hypothetical protein